MLVFFLYVPSDLWRFLPFRDESSAHFVRSLYRITASLGLLEVARLLLKGYADALSWRSTWDVVDGYVFIVRLY